MSTEPIDKGHRKQNLDSGKLPGFNTICTAVDDKLDPRSEQIKLAPMQTKKEGKIESTDKRSTVESKPAPIEPKRGYDAHVSTDDALDNAVAEDAGDLEDIKRYREEQEGQ